MTEEELLKLIDQFAAENGREATKTLLGAAEKRLARGRGRPKGANNYRKWGLAAQLQWTWRPTFEKWPEDHPDDWVSKTADRIIENNYPLDLIYSSVGKTRAKQGWDRNNLTRALNKEKNEMLKEYERLFIAMRKAAEEAGSLEKAFPVSEDQDKK